MLAHKLAITVLAGAFLLVGTTACKKAEKTTEPVATLTTESAVATASDEPAPTAEELAAAEAVQDIFSNGDDTAVTAGAEGPTFSLVEPMTVTVLVTLHVGGGVPAGSIALKDASGKVYGPFAVHADPAPDGNTYWSCEPKVKLPIGDYTVVDSDPATWAKNDGSDGFGFVTVRGIVGE